MFSGKGKGVSDRTAACMADEGTQTIAYLRAEGNYVGRLGSEDLLLWYKEALGKVTGRGGIPVEYGILPRLRVGGTWPSRVIAMDNGWTTGTALVTRASVPEGRGSPFTEVVVLIQRWKSKGTYCFKGID